MLLDRHRVAQLIELSALERTVKGPERQLRAGDVEVLVKAAYDDAVDSARAEFMARVQKMPSSAWPWSAVQVTAPRGGGGGGGGGLGSLVAVPKPGTIPTPALLATTGLVMWSALYGATGRPSALVGGLFALLAPIAVALVPARRQWVPWAVGLVWSGAAVAVARTGGIATNLSSALRWAAAMAAVGIAASAALLARGHARARTAG